MRLKNKIALITGAAQGIGKSIAEMFVTEGAQVILTDINDTLGQKQANDIKSTYYHLDVACEADWVATMSAIKQKFNRLDILVNNAGITGFGNKTECHDPEYSELKSWQNIHGVNIDGTFLGCKYAIAAMKEHGGSIINLSSRSGIVGIPRAVAYASSKAAILNHTRSVALYCCEENYNIRCNTICPAAILTPMWEEMLGSNPAQREKAILEISQSIPMKKMGVPLDVAYAAVYLASDESSYMTGSEIHIDGGVLAGTASSPRKVSE